MRIPLEERKLQSRAEFLDDIAMSMGGYAAEKLVYGDVTTGPSNDLQVATGLARAMVTRWGMSDLIGPVALETDGGRGVFGEQFERDKPDHESARVVGQEVKRILNEGLARATEVLTRHRSILDVIAKKLMEVETLEQAEYEKIISAHGIALKKVTV